MTLPIDLKSSTQGTGFAVATLSLLIGASYHSDIPPALIFVRCSPILGQDLAFSKLLSGPPGRVA